MYITTYMFILQTSESQQTTAVMGVDKYYTTTNTLTITPTMAYHGREYTCVISGKQMDDEQFITSTLNVQCEYHLVYLPLV